MCNKLKIVIDGKSLWSKRNKALEMCSHMKIIHFSVVMAIIKKQPFLTLSKCVCTSTVGFIKI